MLLHVDLVFRIFVENLKKQCNTAGLIFVGKLDALCLRLLVHTQFSLLNWLPSKMIYLPGVTHSFPKELALRTDNRPMHVEFLLLANNHEVCEAVVGQSISTNKVSMVHSGSVLKQTRSDDQQSSASQEDCLA